MWLLETETRNEMRHAEKHGMTPTAAERYEDALNKIRFDFQLSMRYLS